MWFIFITVFYKPKSESIRIIEINFAYFGTGIVVN